MEDWEAVTSLVDQSWKKHLLPLLSCRLSRNLRVNIKNATNPTPPQGDVAACGTGHDGVVGADTVMWPHLGTAAPLGLGILGVRADDGQPGVPRPQGAAQAV